MKSEFGGAMGIEAQAFLSSLLAGLATGIGGLMAAAMGRVRHDINDFLLGFSAGVMVSVATFGLVHEAMDKGGVLISVISIAIGFLTLYLLDRYLPHLHEVAAGVAVSPAYHRGLLIAIAIAMHNAPEGMAVGISYSSIPRLGLLLAIVIALHNIPEGISVAVPFRSAGFPAWRCVCYATASGLIEPLTALAGILLVEAVKGLIPFALAFAGGAMLYVVSDELIPESHSHGYEHQASFGFVVGFILLLVLLHII